MAFLEVQDLKKQFSGKPHVLNGVNFSLEKGETLAIIGPSGAGKTTLLRCLNSLIPIDGGKVLFNGETLLEPETSVRESDEELRKKRSHFGLLFQDFNLFPQYTVLRNVTLAGELLAKKRPDYRENKKQILSEIEDNAKRLLAEVGLADRMDRYPHELSGGQKQRTAIARALAVSPDILCFDEPTSALDPELSGEVLRVIRSLAEHHMTVIIVTHEMAFARDVADKVIFLDKGIVQEQGPAREVIDNPKAERTRRFLARYHENSI